MTAGGGDAVDLDTVWRVHSRKVLATLIRLLRDFDLAEEALHDAYLAAANRWPSEGVPATPSAWLISAGRFRAIDKIRQRARFEALEADLAHLSSVVDELQEDHEIADDQLRLIFTCCHPAIPPEAQVALTLREVCGLTTEEIARAFLTRAPTVAQRIVRAKARIRDAKLPYEVPGQEELPERLNPVLRVIYLVHNEGYSAHSGASLQRPDLSAEAVRLGRLIAGLLPDAEVLGLLGLMLLNESRRTARQTEAGDVILLADQDRALWDRALIAEGTALVDRAFATRQIGPYALQGAIAAIHAAAPTTADTDWTEILGLYGVLQRAAPSPVVQLNRAVAVSMVHGPAAGLAVVEPLLAAGELCDYHLAHVAKADMLRQLGRRAEAADAYTRAIILCRQEPERRLLQRRLDELGR